MPGIYVLDTMDTDKSNTRLSIQQVFTGVGSANKGSEA